MTRSIVALFAAAAAGASLTACGGGGGSSIAAPPPPPARGTLLGTANAASLSKAAIDSYDADGSLGPVQPGETASCAVSVLQLQYATIDPSGANVHASAGLLVPSGTGCTGLRPLVALAHGTVVSAAFDASDPSSEVVLASAKYFASHGYVVVIPDYLGYGVSRAYTTVHPYVMAEADAATVIDAVRAARQWFGTSDGAGSGVALSGTLLLTGTSEGGYIAMATQRTMERDFPAEFSIAASVPISGPYDLSSEVLYDLKSADAQGNSDSGAATFLLTSYQAGYGDLYAQPSDAFRSPWDADVAGLFPSTVFTTEAQAIKACKIPVNVDTAPSPPPAGCSSSNPLLQAQFVADYLAATAGTPGGVARAHVDDNDLVTSGWSPASTTVPCYGDLDTMAAANARAAAQAFQVTAVDVQTTGPAFIVSWMRANANSPSYHGTIEAGGCTAYARYAVFDPLVTPVVN